MTVSTTTPRVSYSGNSTTGNDGTGSFAYSKYFLNDADLKVIKTVTATGVPTVMTLTTDYTISGTKVNTVYPNGATVVINSGEGKYPLTTETITIINDPAPTQTIDYTANDAFPAETHERGLDKLTVLVQRLDDRADRTLSKPDTTNNWDAGSNRIINVGTPTLDNDAATKSFVASSVLAASINPVSSNNILFVYDTVAAMKAADIDAGTLVMTKGYYSAGDGGGGRYRITASASVDDYIDHDLSNGNSAILQIDDALNLKQAGAVGDDTTDDSSAIQAAINYMNAKGGGVISVPVGDYACANLTPKANVTIDSGVRGLSRSNTSQTKPRFRLNASGAILDFSVAADNFACFGIVFNGAKLSSGTARGVVLGRDISLFGDASDVIIYRANFGHCTFANFQQEGLLAKNTTALMMDNCFAETNLRDSSYYASVIRSSVAIYGNDSTVTNSEFTALNDGAASSVNLRRTAFGFYGDTSRAHSFISDCIGETSDIGFVFDQQQVRASNCRADTNYGHGFIISQNGGQYSNCTAFKNSQETGNTYNGFAIGGSSNTFTGCVAGSTVALAKKHRWGFNDYSTETGQDKQNLYIGCRSFDHQTASFSIARGFYQTPTGIEIAFAENDATPSVDQWGSYVTANTSSTTITNFDTNINGQRIEVRVNDTNTTFDHGTYIKTPTGAAVSASADRVYVFVLRDTVWYLLNT